MWETVPRTARSRDRLLGRIALRARLCRLLLAAEARDEIRQIAGRARRAHQIALHLGAASAAHDVELLLGLDALGGRLDAEARPEARDRLDDDRAVTVAVDVL